jgi:cytochrome oxidase Cu insertion factor (SCO1/SenC/PrrC family)
MFSAFRSLAYAATFALLGSSTAFSQDKENPTSERDQPGLKVGEKAPKFKLKDQDGNERSLDDLLKKRKVALVFYRSADW